MLGPSEAVQGGLAARKTARDRTIWLQISTQIDNVGGRCCNLISLASYFASSYLNQEWWNVIYIVRRLVCMKNVGILGQGRQLSEFLNLGTGEAKGDEGKLESTSLLSGLVDRDDCLLAGMLRALS